MQRANQETLNADIETTAIDTLDVLGLVTATSVSAEIFGVTFQHHFVLATPAARTGASISIDSPKIEFRRNGGGYDIYFVYASAKIQIDLLELLPLEITLLGGESLIFHIDSEVTSIEINFSTENIEPGVPLLLPGVETEIAVSVIDDGVETLLAPITQLGGDIIRNLLACVPGFIRVETSRGPIAIADIRSSDGLEVIDQNGDKHSILGVAVFSCDGKYITLEKDNKPFYIKSNHPIWVDGESKLPGTISKKVANLQTKESYSLVTEKRIYVPMEGFYVCTWAKKALELSDRVYRLV